ncbi:MAG: ABC transporter ATP-binding protein [Planctomycetota bacterium]|nr:MAG: ABC transporter ATP-binding protein [Planctomycetota bacterium]
MNATDMLLRAQGLHKHLGGKLVVEDVDLTVQAGQVIALLGANGAGKTTTLRMCYGMLEIEQGQVSIAGHDLRTTPDAALRHLGVCTQDDTFDSDLNCRENLMGMGRYFRLPRAQVHAQAEALLDHFHLRPYAKAKPETLSGGYRRRLGIARALVHQPRVLFLDEPTTGLDPQARMEVWDLIHDLQQQGLGIVLTTHYMDEAQRLANVVQVLDQGRVVARGTVNDVLGVLVGEHVVVIPGQHSELVAAIQRWLQERQLPAPERILHEWHIAVNNATLIQLNQHFDANAFVIRKPTLDDLFIALARSGARHA